MNEADLVDVALTLREQIDFLWNFYMTACALLIGWTFSSRITWDPDKQRVVMILFVMFAVVNLAAIFKDYRLLELALSELQLMPAASGRFLSRFSGSSGLGAQLAAMVHLLGDAVIFLLLRQCTDHPRQS